MLALDPAMQLLAVDGIGVMLAAVLVAGVVYGFAGFGPALVAIPVLTRYLEPEVAVLAFGMAGLGAAVTMLPRVWPPGGPAGDPLDAPLRGDHGAALPSGCWPTPIRDPCAGRSARRPRSP